MSCDDLRRGKSANAFKRGKHLFGKRSIHGRRNSRLERNRTDLDLPYRIHRKDAIKMEGNDYEIPVQGQKETTKRQEKNAPYNLFDDCPTDNQTLPQLSLRHSISSTATTGSYSLNYGFITPASFVAENPAKFISRRKTPYDRTSRPLRSYKIAPTFLDKPQRGDAIQMEDTDNVIQIQRKAEAVQTQEKVAALYLFDNCPTLSQRFPQLSLHHSISSTATTSNKGGLSVDNSTIIPAGFFAGNHDNFFSKRRQPISSYQIASTFLDITQGSGAIQTEEKDIVIQTQRRKETVQTQANVAALYLFDNCPILSQRCPQLSFCHSISSTATKSNKARYSMDYSSIIPAGFVAGNTAKFISRRKRPYERRSPPLESYQIALTFLDKPQRGDAIQMEDTDNVIQARRKEEAVQSQENVAALYVFDNCPNLSQIFSQLSLHHSISSTATTSNKGGLSVDNSTIIPAGFVGRNRDNFISRRRQPISSYQIASTFLDITQGSEAIQMEETDNANQTQRNKEPEQTQINEEDVQIQKM